MFHFKARRAVFAWAMYDWANSAFATTVMVAFFPLFFHDYWSRGAGAETTARLSFANTAASFCVALAAPLFGAIADRGGKCRPLLAVFSFFGIAGTAGLALIGAGDWFGAALTYTAASIGFAAANIFYDSLLLSVAETSELDRASSLGYALGYVGGGLLLALNAAMTLSPTSFGLASPAAAVRVSFATVAVWWALFSLPLWLFVAEPHGHKLPIGRAVLAGLGELRETLRTLRSYRAVWLFLVAYWLYIDGVYTVQKLAVDFGLSIGFKSANLIEALLVTQFVAFPAALGFGRLAGAIGPRRAILLGVAAYVLMTIWAYRMHAVWEFFGLAIGVGIVQGGVQSLSRSFFGRLVPSGREAEFFGFFNMWGKFAATLGPAIAGIVALETGSSRASILSLILLFLSGAWFLWHVPETSAARA
jgi:MFS transporter, UMF1 family